MAVKSIELVNIMAHKHSLFEFPETGIINICGENSDGKSILTRAVFRTLIKPSLHLKGPRESLINYDATYGEVNYTFYDKPDLKVHIEREISRTYYLDKETNIQVFVGEKVEYINAYVSKFGLSTLNVYRSLQPLIFGTTSLQENYEALALAARDYVVEEAVAQFELNEKELKKGINDLETYIDKMKAFKAGLPIYDKAKEQDFLYKGEDLVILLSAIVDSPTVDKLSTQFFSPPETLTLDVPEVLQIPIPKAKPIKPVLNFKIPDLKPITFTQFNIPKIFDLDIQLDKMDFTHLKEAEQNLSKLQEQECPTCGRRLCDANH